MEKADDGTTVNVYFDRFTSTETCVVIQSIQQCTVENLLDSTIEVTDYYSPGNFPQAIKSNSFYNFTFKLLEKKSQILYNIPANLPDCKNLPPEEEFTTKSPPTWGPPIFWEEEVMPSPPQEPMPDPPQEPSPEPSPEPSAEPSPEPSPEPNS